MEKSELTLIGPFYFDRHESLHIVSKAIESEIDLSRPVQFYEEVKPTLLLPLKMDSTFFDEGLSNGDVLVCEVGLPSSSSLSLSSSSSSSSSSPLSLSSLCLTSSLCQNSSRRGCIGWYELFQHQGWVQFSQHTNPKVTFSLFLSKKLLLAEVKKEIAKRMGCEEKYVTFTSALASDSISLAALLRVSTPRGTVAFDISSAS